VKNNYNGYWNVSWWHVLVKTHVLDVVVVFRIHKSWANLNHYNSVCHHKLGREQDLSNIVQCFLYCKFSKGNWETNPCPLKSYLNVFLFQSSNLNVQVKYCQFFFSQMWLVTSSWYVIINIWELEFMCRGKTYEYV
jgi:hypothetical protein